MTFRSKRTRLLETFEKAAAGGTFERTDLVAERRSCALGAPRLRSRLFICAAYFFLSAWAPALQSTSFRVRWFPQQPVQGSFIQLEVSLVSEDSTARIRGELGGEPLHFMPEGSSTFR